MQLLPRIRMSRRLQQQQATNPFSERGLEKFSQVYEELNAKRKIIAAETGAEISLVRFRSRSTTGEWVPILPPPPEDLQVRSSVEIFTPSPEVAENLTDMAASKKSAGKSNWAASKAHIVCFIRNKSWKQISKSSVVITIATVFFCTGKMIAVAAIAAMAVCIWAWKHRQMQDSSSPSDHREIMTETTDNIHLPASGFLQIHTQSAPPSPKSSSKTCSLHKKAKRQKSRSQDLAASTSNTVHKGSDQRARKRISQHNVKSQTPSRSSAGGMESFSVLVLLSTILLGRIPAVLFTVFCFVLLNVITLRSKSQFHRMQETAMGRSSKSKAAVSVAFNKPAIIHSDITSSEYRKKVIIEGLLERPNRR